MKFGGRAAASFLQNKQTLSVDPTLVSRFNATWVPNKLTLILLKVTDAEEGEYRCEVISFGSSVQTWIRTIQVSLLGKLNQLVNRSLNVRIYAILKAMILMVIRVLREQGLCSGESTHIPPM